MPVGGEILIVGEYAVTYDGTAVGLVQFEEGAPAITQIARSRAIKGTTKYGETKIDSIHLGFDYTLEMVLMEYTKALAAFTMGYTFGRQGLIGALKYGLAKAVVLTATTGTPAQVAGAPSTLTASKAVLADDHQGKLFYGPQVRTVPLKLDLLPYDLGSSVVGNFSMT